MTDTEKQYAVYAIHPHGKVLRVNRPTTKELADEVRDLAIRRHKIEIVPLEVHEYPWDGAGEGVS